MIIFLLSSCSSPPQVQGPKHLTIFRGQQDDIIENVASALMFHHMEPELIVYHPVQKELAVELKKELLDRCTILEKSAHFSISSLPDDTQSVLLLTNSSHVHKGSKIQLQPNSYVSFSSMTKEWDTFFSQAKERITPLIPNKTYALESVLEPSGLAIHPKTHHLWTVSDETGAVFDLGIDARKPEIPHAHLAFQITEFEENDLEGIAFVDSNICIVVESQRRLLCFDDAYTKISDQKIEGPYNPNKPNKGPEGISNDGIIINEGFPTAISNTGRILSIGTDISGIEKDGSHYWILSQSDATITRLSANFAVQRVYNFPDEGLEGIAIEQNSLFVISDPNETLYEIPKPSSAR